MAAVSNSPEAVVSPLGIPEDEQREIVELYRNALLTGSQAQLVSPNGKGQNIPRPVYNLLVQILRGLSEGSSVAIIQERQGLTTVQASRCSAYPASFLSTLWIGARFSTTW
jgi:hypothetical protein